MKPRANRNLMLHGLVLVAAMFGLPRLMHTRPAGPNPAEVIAPVTSIHEPERLRPAKSLVETAPAHGAMTVAQAGIKGGASGASPRASEPSSAASQPTSVANGASVAASTPATLDRSAQIAEIDPETGLLGPPTLEPARAIASAARLAAIRLPADPIEIRRPDGAVGIELADGFREFAVVRVGPDQKPVFGCLHSDHPRGPSLADTLAGQPRLEER